MILISKKKKMKKIGLRKEKFSQNHRSDAIDNHKKELNEETERRSKK